MDIEVNQKVGESLNAEFGTVFCGSQFTASSHALDSIIQVLRLVGLGVSIEFQLSLGGTDFALHSAEVTKLEGKT